MKLPRQALPLLQKSIRSDARNPEYRYHLGLVYLEHGDHAMARRSLEEALRLDPRFPGSEDAEETLASIRG